MISPQTLRQINRLTSDRPRYFTLRSEGRTRILRPTDPVDGAELAAVTGVRDGELARRIAEALGLLDRTAEAALHRAPDRKAFTRAYAAAQAELGEVLTGAPRAVSASVGAEAARIGARHAEAATGDLEKAHAAAALGLDGPAQARLLTLPADVAAEIRDRVGRDLLDYAERQHRMLVCDGTGDDDLAQGEIVLMYVCVGCDGVLQAAYSTTDGGFVQGAGLPPLDDAVCAGHTDDEDDDTDEDEDEDDDTDEAARGG